LAGSNDFTISKSDPSFPTKLMLRNTNTATGEARLVVENDTNNGIAAIQYTTGNGGGIQNWLSGMNGTTAFEIRNLTVAGVPFSANAANNNITMGDLALSIGGQAPGPRLLVGKGGAGATAEELRIDAGSGAGGDAYLSGYRNGVNKFKLGISGSANDLITGSASNDTNYMATQKTNWSAAGSAAIQMSLNPSGFLGLGIATGSFPLHVMSGTSPQIVGEFDATHRTILSNDGTNGYGGTSTNNPYILRTNNTNALTISTAQNANFVGTVGLNDATATYPFSIVKTGTACIGNLRCLAVILDSGTSLGPSLGYNATDNASIIKGSDVLNSNLDFWVNSGVGASTKQLSLTNTGATITGKISSYNTIATAGDGVPAIRGVAPLTISSASIGATIIYTVPAAGGQYRVCWSQNITRAATSSSSLITTITWNNGAAKTSTYWVDPSAGTTGTTADASNTLGSERGNCFTSYMFPGNIQYATTYSTTGATTMQYIIAASVEKLQQ